MPEKVGSEEGSSSEPDTNKRLETEKSDSEKAPECSVQKDEITPQLNKRLEKGDTWYLLDVRWFKQWKKYVGFESWDQQQMGSETAHPGPVDTSCLFKDREREVLKDHLMEDLDYSLVPEEVWKKFTSWYGIEESSRVISRRVVEHGLYVKHCKVEVYLVEFKLALHPDIDSVVTKKFSRADNVEHVMNTMKQLYNIPEEKECRLWHKYMLSTYDLLNKLDETIQDAGLYTNQLLLLEQKKDDDTWPRETTTYTGTNMTSVRSSDFSSTSTHSTSSAYTRNDSKSNQCDNKLTSTSNKDSFPVTAQPRPDSKIYAKSQEYDELADSLQQMQKDAMTIKEEFLSQFEQIGHGRFGVVVSAVYSPVPRKKIKVAIKKTIDCYSVGSKEDFLQEIAVTKTFVHPNIVRVYGSVDKGGSSPWLVLEYFPNGDLKSFLMENNCPVNQLVKYMIDVAMAMHYLSEKKYVHRDLAARNILMDQNELCKVGDFGLLRKTTKDDGQIYSYMEQTKSALPIRWMAVESLTDQKTFPMTSASDVWSFGILMWELFNPHLLPYRETTSNTQVIKDIVAGKRLEIPQQCPQAVAQVMGTCWISDHTKRPSFLVIVNLLQHSMMQM